jgi:PilZ domain
MSIMRDIQQQVQLRADQRRATERQVTVLINAGVSYGGRDGLCRIRNISAGGMNIETRMQMAVDSVIAIQLRSGRYMEGRVRWVKDSLVGLSLAAYNADDLLADRVSNEAVARTGAFPRFERVGSVGFAINHRRRRGALLGISLADVTIETDDLPLGAVVTVEIDGLGEHLAKVVRTGEGSARAMFTQPLNYRALEAWLHDRPCLPTSAPEVQDFTI